MHIDHKPVLVVATTTALLLLLPALGMAFSSEMRWGPGDFLAAAVLIFSAGMGIVAVRRLATGRARALLVAAVLLGLATVWAELAVGIFH